MGICINPGWEAIFQKQSKWRSFTHRDLPGHGTIYLELLHIKPQVRCVLLLRQQQVSVIKKESSQSRRSMNICKFCANSTSLSPTNQLLKEPSN